MTGAVRQRKIWHPLPYLRSSCGLCWDVSCAPEENDGSSQEQQGKPRGHGARNLSLIDRRLPKRLPQTEENQYKANQRHEEADPWNRSCRKSRERQPVRQGAEYRQQHADPWGEGALSYRAIRHCDLSVAPSLVDLLERVLVVEREIPTPKRTGWRYGEFLGRFWVPKAVPRLL